MDELAEDLRATTESIAHDAQRLREIEIEKAGLDVDDPRVRDLSQQGRELGERIAQGTAAEDWLAGQVADRAADEARD